MTRPRTVLVLALVLLAAIPAASATHWSLHYSAIDRSAGETREPDGAVFHNPTGVLDGHENRVVAPGLRPGDGSLFLDARVGNLLGAPIYAEGPILYADVVTAGTMGERDVLLPGYVEAVAWYGWWLDADTDGAITDVADQACGSTSCPGDEFLWRGLATMESLEVVLFWPGDESTSIEHTDLEDHTAPDPVPSGGDAAAYGEQAWRAGFTSRLRGSFIDTWHTITVAGAPRALGPATGFDVNAPGVLFDVDRYAALSPEAATLYASVFALSESALDVARDAFAEEIAPIAALVTAVVADVSATADTLKAPVLALAQSPAAAGFVVSTPTGKEPTTSLDDFEGRAFFGGDATGCDADDASAWSNCRGDSFGSFNTYPAYADGYHYYLDAAPVTRICAGAYAEAPGTGLVQRGPSACQDAVRSADPAGTLDGDDRRPGVVLTFIARSLLWFDTNRDTHIGPICDPSDDESFDAERNTCTPDTHPRPWPHRYFGEFLNVCDSTSVKGGTARVTPLGGSWGNAVLVRDYAESTRVAFDANALSFASDDSAITLRFNPTCDALPEVRTRDAIVFPEGGSRIPIRIEVESGISGFVDSSRGIDIGPERVRDVDFLPATF